MSMRTFGMQMQMQSASQPASQRRQHRGWKGGAAQCGGSAGSAGSRGSRSNGTAATAAGVLKARARAKGEDAAVALLRRDLQLP